MARGRAIPTGVERAAAAGPAAPTQRVPDALREPRTRGATSPIQPETLRNERGCIRLVDWKAAAAAVGVMLALSFAGCIGNDSAEAAPEEFEAEEAVATEVTGSVTGQVATNELELLQGVELGLTDRTGNREATTTDKKGQFTFNGIEAGTYRLELTAVCCRVASKEVKVVAGEVTEANLQVQRLTADDLKTPFVREDEWNGFISCGVGAAATALAACALADDPNEDFLHGFEVVRGLTEFVAGMQWRPVGGVSSDQMNLLVERTGCSGCNERYADVEGPSPLIARVTDATISDEDAKFALIEDTATMRFRIFTGGVGVVYQQPFTVYWYEFYYHTMPEGFQVVPDE